LIWAKIDVLTEHRLALLNIFHQYGPDDTRDPVAFIFTFDSLLSFSGDPLPMKTRSGLGLTTPSLSYFRCFLICTDMMRGTLGALRHEAAEVW